MKEPEESTDLSIIENGEEKSPNSDPLSQKRFKIALFGGKAAGKTCILAALSLERLPHPLDYSISLHQPAPGSSKKEKADWEAIKTAANEIREGRLPEATPIKKGMGLTLTVKSPETGAYELEIFDYSGELVEDTSSDSELAKEIFDQIRDSDGVLVLAEYTRKRGEFAAGLNRLGQAFNALKDTIRSKKLNIPVALLINKWDRNPAMEVGSRNEEQQSIALQEFLDSNEGVSHRNLQTQLKDTIGKEYKEFPVSAFGKPKRQSPPTGTDVGLNDRPILVDGILESFGLEAPFLWLARKAEEIALEKIQNECKSAHASIWPWAPYLALHHTNKELLRFPEQGDAWKKGVQLRAALRRRVAKNNLFAFLTIVTLAAGILANNRYKTSKNDEIAWSQIESVTSLPEKAKKAKVYLDNFPRAKHKLDAEKIIEEQRYHDETKEIREMLDRWERKYAQFDSSSRVEKDIGEIDIILTEIDAERPDIMDKSLRSRADSLYTKLNNLRSEIENSIKETEIAQVNAEARRRVSNWQTQLSKLELSTKYNEVVEAVDSILRDIGKQGTSKLLDEENQRDLTSLMTKFEELQGKAKEEIEKEILGRIERRKKEFFDAITHEVTRIEGSAKTEQVLDDINILLARLEDLPEEVDVADKEVQQEIEALRKHCISIQLDVRSFLDIEGKKQEYRDLMESHDPRDAGKYLAELSSDDKVELRDQREQYRTLIPSKFKAFVIDVAKEGREWEEAVNLLSDFVEESVKDDPDLFPDNFMNDMESLMEEIKRGGDRYMYQEIYRHTLFDEDLRKMLIEYLDKAPIGTMNDECKKMLQYLEESNQQHSIELVLDSVTWGRDVDSVSCNWISVNGHKKGPFESVKGSTTRPISNNRWSIGSYSKTDILTVQVEAEDDGSGAFNVYDFLGSASETAPIRDFQAGKNVTLTDEKVGGTKLVFKVEGFPVEYRLPPYPTNP